MNPIPLTETQMAELFWLRVENAALKEQVAQLLDHNKRLESSASAIMDKQQEKLTSEQDKAKVLTDALESLKNDTGLVDLMRIDQVRRIDEALATVNGE